MKLLTHEDIINMNINPFQCYEWVSELLKNKEQTILPAKISMKPTEEIFYNVMPSLLPSYDVGGVKVVNRYPGRVPSLDSQILIYNLMTGDLKAMLDGNYITTMRTGAVAAHSVHLLAKSNFSTVGWIGLGNQARAAAKVLLSIYPSEPLQFKLFKYKDHHVLFEEYIKNLPNSERVSFTYCDSYVETIENSEVIISSVTYFSQDICPDEYFMSGCLIVPIHTRGFKNCDLFFDKVFADDTKHVDQFEYFKQFKSFAEITDILTGKKAGRENDEERIIVYNIGLSIHDIFFANKIYQESLEKKFGQNISLEAPKDKFWI